MLLPSRREGGHAVVPAGKPGSVVEGDRELGVVERAVLNLGGQSRIWPSRRSAIGPSTVGFVLASLRASAGDATRPWNGPAKTAPPRAPRIKVRRCIGTIAPQFDEGWTCHANRAGPVITAQTYDAAARRPSPSRARRTGVGRSSRGAGPCPGRHHRECHGRSFCPGHRLDGRSSPRARRCQGTVGPRHEGRMKPPASDRRRPRRTCRNDETQIPSAVSAAPSVIPPPDLRLHVPFMVGSIRCRPWTEV